MPPKTETECITFRVIGKLENEITDDDIANSLIDTMKIIYDNLNEKYMRLKTSYDAVKYERDRFCEIVNKFKPTDLAKYNTDSIKFHQRNEFLKYKNLKLKRSVEHSNRVIANLTRKNEYLKYCNKNGVGSFEKISHIKFKENSILQKENRNLRFVIDEFDNRNETLLKDNQELRTKLYSTKENDDMKTRNAQLEYRIKELYTEISNLKEKSLTHSLSESNVNRIKESLERQVNDLSKENKVLKETAVFVETEQNRVMRMYKERIEELNRHVNMYMSDRNYFKDELDTKNKKLELTLKMICDLNTEVESLKSKNADLAKQEINDNMKRREFVPFEASHPGSLLNDELKYRGISQKYFAKDIGMQEAVLNEIIKEKRAISAEIAVMLEKGLGIPADCWVRHQAGYELDCVRIQERNHKKI